MASFTIVCSERFLLNDLFFLLPELFILIGFIWSIFLIIYIQSNNIIISTIKLTYFMQLILFGSFILNLPIILQK